MNRKLIGIILSFVLFAFLICSIKFTIDDIKNNYHKTMEWRKTIKNGDSVQIGFTDKLREIPTYGVVDSISLDSVYYIHLETKNNVLYKK